MFSSGFPQQLSDFIALLFYRFVRGGKTFGRVGRINGVLAFPDKGPDSGDGAGSGVAEGAAQPG